MAKARIVTYMHCKTCMRISKNPNGTTKITSKERIVVGWTKEGIQIYCENCGNSVMDIDFKGQKMAYYQSKSQADKLPLAKKQ